MSLGNLFSLAFCLAALAPSTACAGLVTVDFGSLTGGVPLPYSEDGFTFTNTVTGNVGIFGSPDNHLLITGIANSPVAVRVTSAANFDLRSFDIESTVATNWTIVASSGASRSIAGATPAGTLDFTSLSGWQNISYFDISNVGASNSSIRLDNFAFESPSAVPEPSSLALLSFAGIAMAAAMRRR